MRRSFLALVLLPLAACNRSQDPIDIRLPTLPADIKKLELKDSPVYRRQWNYPVELRSRSEDPVRISVRHEGPSKDKLRVKLVGETKLLPVGSGRATLIIAPPMEVGPFSGTITIYSDDLPEWSWSISFEGNVVKVPQPGKHIRFRPSGVNLGKLKPGGTAEFALGARNDGTDPLTITEWRVRHPDRVRLIGVRGGERLAPGEELEVRGTVAIPKAAGPFEERIDVFSDADNAKVRQLVVGGVVVPDHTTLPGRLHLGNVFAATAPVVKVRIRAEKDVAPFVVTGVKDAAPYFDVVTLGGKEPAAEQQVELRLKKSAPLGRVELKMRLRVEPPGADVEWPVQMNVVPSIHPQPPRLSFGKVRSGTSRILEITLASFARREFKVTAARSEKGLFGAQVRHAQGLPWRILVHVADNVRPGALHDKIVIETDDPDTPVIHVPVYAEYVR